MASVMADVIANHKSELRRCICEASRVISRKAIVFAFVLAILAISSLSVHPVNAVPESNMLNVPYHNQFESGDPNSGIFCAPTSVEMALEYISGQVIPQTTLAVELKTGPVDNGTGVENVYIPFTNRGYTAVKAGSRSTLDNLKALNAMGYVSILDIHFDTNHKSGHFILVTGYNQTGIIVNDPWPTSKSQPLSRRTGKNAFISDGLLTDLWTRKNQWMIQIPYPPHVGAFMVPISAEGVPINVQLMAAGLIEPLLIAFVAAAAIILASQLKWRRTHSMILNQ